MTVATLRLDLRFRDCLTPRDARRQIQTIMDKLHKHFNVSVADADLTGDPGATLLLVAAVGRTKRDARETLERVADAVAAHPRAEVLGLAVTEL
jgi:uncharacterized protein YlxP (DUF503 family)